MKMKKLFAVLAALILCISVTALAETPPMYYPEDLSEFASDSLGFSVLYPVLFADFATDSDDSSAPGLHALLPDSSAELSITREENITGLVNETWIALTLQEYPDAQSNIDEVSGTSRVLIRKEKSSEFTCCLFSDGWQYSISITWDASHDDEISPLVEFISNSLAVYELGIG